MKILVTGSSGYVGSNFIDLYGKNNFIKCCDYDTDLPPAHELTKSDIFGVDAIIHFAALSGIAACENKPLEAVRDNILSANKVFKLSSIFNIPCIGISSQAACNPHSSLYANNKFVIEKLARYYNDEKDGNIIIVRFSNIYGGLNYLEKKGTCVKQFVTNYKNNKPLIVNGNGNQKRDFIHVDDICKSLMMILEKKICYNEPIDIGSGIGTSILYLANMFPNAKIEHVSDNGMVGVESSISDTSLAEKLFGFKAEKKLGDYIMEMIK